MSNLNYITTNHISYWCGYVDKPVKNDELLQLYLKHAKDIIADGDDKVCEYVLNWLSYIF